MIVSKYTDRIERMRVGWSIRCSNGRLAVITWIAPSGGAYTAKVVDTLLDAQPHNGGGERVTAAFEAFGDSIGF